MTNLLSFAQRLAKAEKKLSGKVSLEKDPWSDQILFQDLSPGRGRIVGLGTSFDIRHEPESSYSPGHYAFGLLHDSCGNEAEPYMVNAGAPDAYNIDQACGVLWDIPPNLVLHFKVNSLELAGDRIESWFELSLDPLSSAIAASFAVDLIQKSMPHRRVPHVGMPLKASS